MKLDMGRSCKVNVQGNVITCITCQKQWNTDTDFVKCPDINPVSRSAKLFSIICLTALIVLAILMS